jgi:hypothetical protein
MVFHGHGVHLCLLEIRFLAIKRQEAFISPGRISMFTMWEEDVE